ncbi:MAG: multiubiquitin domain-containing protein [Sphingomonas sp.]|jgi:hypothetical protein|uniref:multiubiquitin domain-containing protein n=1 Tax=Sphingomonas sp. TaxID=28214 RepID=UPI0035612C5C
MKPTDAPEQAGIHDRDTFKLVAIDENFAERHITLPDAKPTGRQIAEAAGFRPADDAIVLQQLADGALEELRLEELVDLRESGVERFFVIAGDRTYRLMIDGLRMEWPRVDVSGDTIRNLVRKSEEFEVFQDFDDAPNALIEDDQVVSLGGDGLERFITKRGEKLVSVTYNGETFKLERRTYTTEELRQVFGVEEGYILQLVTKAGEFVELKPGRTLPIKKDMTFVSHAPCGHSS